MAKAAFNQNVLVGVLVVLGLLLGGLDLLAGKTTLLLVGLPSTPDGVVLVGAVLGPHHVVDGASRDAVTMLAAKITLLGGESHDRKHDVSFQGDVISEVRVLEGGGDDLATGYLVERVGGVGVEAAGLDPLEAFVGVVGVDWHLAKGISGLHGFWCFKLID